MCTTVDETIDQSIRERFETVLPTGSVSPAFIDGRGIQVLMPGHVDHELFVMEASALIALSLELGLLDADARLAHARVQARAVLRRHARPHLDEDGLFALDWNVRPGEQGVIPVTVYEA